MRFLAVYLPTFVYLIALFDAKVSSSNATDDQQHSTSYDEFEQENSTSIEEDRMDPSAQTANLTLKMGTPCETPYNELAYCVEIRECPSLLKLLFLGNSQAEEFLRASMCGPTNENHSNPKVCCGIYNPSRKPSHVSKDIDIFPKVCGRQKMITRGRIMGGEVASLGEFPWMARIIMKNRAGLKMPGCGGALIHPKFVLTAAHCIKTLQPSTVTPYSVALGEHDTTTKVDCTPKGTECADRPQISRIVKVIVHPEYNPEIPGYYNDIALIYLKKSIRITDYVQPICVLEDPNQVPYRYSVSGWGKTETAEFSTVKMKAHLVSQPRQKCQKTWATFNITVKDTQICAGGQGHRDTCRGDSGGPLMMTTNGTVWFAAGIVSFGLGCGLEGWPGIYTNIPSYVPWIRSLMEPILLVEKRNKLLRNPKLFRNIQKT